MMFWENSARLLLEILHYLSRARLLIALINPVEGKGIELNDLLSLNHLSCDEKEDLIRLFKAGYSSITTKDFSFSCQNDQWFCKKYDYSHYYATKILFRMNKETEYRYNSAVHCSELHLVASMIEQHNRALKEAIANETGEVIEGYEINQKMLDFISNCLEKNVDGCNRMDYAFIRMFVEVIQEYDDVLFERFFNEEE